MLIVARARACLGVRFRAQGREPGFGLDCVGLVAVALGVETPGDYAMRFGSVARVAAAMAELGLVRVEAACAGDVMLFASGAGQLHLGIWTGAGLIHADAGARRVVERPGVGPWPVAGVWRVVASG